MFDVKAVRDRAWHSISYETAQRAGLSLHQLQQFCAGVTPLDEAQLEALGRHLGMNKPKRPPTMAQVQALARRMGIEAPEAA